MPTDTPEPEIIAPGAALVEAGLASALARTEFDVQIATAKAHPRQITVARDKIKSLATLDERTAAASIYALPRAGKPIKGPSIRFAEIVAQQWPNSRIESRVLAVDRGEKVVIAVATFHDLETNVAQRAEERRRIVDKKGKIYSDDMIIVTGKAACSIARRNAILAGVPEGIWWPAYEACEHVVAGDIKTLGERRDRAIKSFAVFGVKPEQIFAALEVQSLDDVTLDHIPTLQGMYSSLKSGEATVEEMFPTPRPAPADAWKPPGEAEAKPEAAKPEAKPAPETKPEAETTQPEPNHDPITGEIIDDNTVIGELELDATENQVESWVSWGARFLKRIAAAPTNEHIDEWLKRNANKLRGVKQDQEKTYRHIENMVKQRRAQLDQQSKQPEQQPEQQAEEPHGDK